jgi:hypothetical protein
LSRSTYSQHGQISAGTVEATFGTWNEAINAAELIPLPQGGLPKSEARRLDALNAEQNNRVERISDEDALRDLVRLAAELRKRPSGNQVRAKGKYDAGVYLKRWGTITAACDMAFEKYGNPLAECPASPDAG